MTRKELLVKDFIMDYYMGAIDKELVREVGDFKLELVKSKPYRYDDEIKEPILYADISERIYLVDDGMIEGKMNKYKDKKSYMIVMKRPYLLEEVV